MSFPIVEKEEPRGASGEGGDKLQRELNQRREKDRRKRTLLSYASPFVSAYIDKDPRE